MRSRWAESPKKTKEVLVSESGKDDRDESGCGREGAIYWCLTPEASGDKCCSATLLPRCARKGTAPAANKAASSLTHSHTHARDKIHNEDKSIFFLFFFSDIIIKSDLSSVKL